MALDTAAKRASAINVGCPWRGILPLPDGDIDQGDRQTVPFLYSGILATESIVVQEQFYPGAGGSYPVRGRKAKEDEWKKRKKQLAELDAIIARAMGEIPQDVPEAQVVKKAAAKVESAEAALPDKPPGFFGSLPPFDLQELVNAAAQAQIALRDYKARKQAELQAAADEDDEDILLLLD